MNAEFKNLHERIRQQIASHDKYETLDGFSYNGITIFAIMLASAATFIPDELVPAIKVLSGCSALLIAIERSLSLGGRWIHHKRLKHEYLVIEAMILNYINYPSELSSEEKIKMCEEIHNKFYQLLRRETEIPGVSNSSGNNLKGDL